MRLASLALLGLLVVGCASPTPPTEALSLPLHHHAPSLTLGANQRSRHEATARLSFPVVFLALSLAPLAHAQFGPGIVYDPTQSAHAISQLSQGEQQLQKWAPSSELEQHLQKEEQIYTTAYTTMNQVISAYNLAYQMSKMPQNLAERYKSDFSQWSTVTNPAFAYFQQFEHYHDVAQCAQHRQPYARSMSAYGMAVIPSPELSLG